MIRYKHTLLGLFGLLSFASGCIGEPPFVTGGEAGSQAKCGAVGEGCCSSGDRCEAGAACSVEDEDLCCATVFGARCRGNGDCCGDSSCSKGRCCGAADTPCGNSHECCGGLRCDGRRCQSTPAGCGGPGQPCCDAGGACGSGLRCQAGACERCGGEGEDCCDDGVCFDALTCGADKKCVQANRRGTGRISDDDCARLDDCDSCRREAGCGWCASSKRCMAGSRSGPAEARCGLMTWVWNPLECRSLQGRFCNVLQTSAQCLTTPACGWCGNCLGGACMAGDVRGPFYASCGMWRTKPDALQCDDFGCMDVGEACTSSVQCCGQLSCRPRQSAGLQCCGEVGAECSTGVDCCGSMGCSGGRCVCVPDGQPSLSGRDCCSGVRNAQGTCGLQSLCAPRRARCSADADCCSNDCDTSASRCR
ncbi:MAG: hypothetical protein ACPGUV_06955 [Polyangiales bacterium]